MLKRVMRLDVCSRVLRVFLHATVACGTEILDVFGVKNWVAMSLYESLLTYVAPDGSRRRSASRYLPRTRVRDTHY